MAYSIDIYDSKWKVVSAFALDEKLFCDEIINPTLIHEYYLLQMSNARNNPAKTKGRWEINGSGKKLYKQKGTGNARAGGKSSPTRKGGGVAFGPRGVQNFTKLMTKKARKIALQWLISMKAKDSEIVGIQSLDFTAPKTKLAADLLTTLGLASKKIVVVLDKNDETLKKSFRNLADVKYLLVDYLNPYDIMHADKLLFTEAALTLLNTTK